MNFERILEHRVLTLIRDGVGNLLALSEDYLMQRSDGDALRGGRRKRWVVCGHQVHGVVSSRDKKGVVVRMLGTPSPRTQVIWRVLLKRERCVEKESVVLLDMGNKLTLICYLYFSSVRFDMRWTFVNF